MTPKAVAQIERLRRRSRSSAQPPAAPEEVIAA
jgi:hypothetical protein